MTNYTGFVLRIPGSSGAFAGKLPRFSSRAAYVAAMATIGVGPTSTFAPGSLDLPRLVTTALSCINFGSPSFVMGCGMLACYLGFDGSVDSGWPGPGSPTMDTIFCDSSTVATPGLGNGFTTWPFTPNFKQLHGSPPFPSGAINGYETPNGGTWPLAQVEGPYLETNVWDFTLLSQGGLYDPTIYGGDFTFTSTPPGGSTWGLHVGWSGCSIVTEFVLRGFSGIGGTLDVTLAAYLMDYSGGIGATPTSTWIGDLGASTDVFTTSSGPATHIFSSGAGFLPLVHLPTAWSIAIMPRIVGITGATAGLADSSFVVLLSSPPSVSAVAAFDVAGFPTCI